MSRRIVWCLKNCLVLPRMQRCTRHAYAALYIWACSALVALQHMHAGHWLLYHTCSALLPIDACTALLPIGASYAYPYEARCCRGQVFGIECLACSMPSAILFAHTSLERTSVWHRVFGSSLCRGQVFGLFYVMRYLVCAHQHSPLCHTNIVVYGTAR